MRPELNVRTFALAFGLALALLVPYEYYWRHLERFPRSFNESDELWVMNRARLDDLGDEDVVIVGSSRGHFDINLDIFDSIAGRRPLMLASPGKSPFYAIEDIVEKTAFKGVLLVSVAPGLFFSPPSAGPAQGMKNERVDLYYKQTPAAAFSQWIYMGLDSAFAYLVEDAALSKWAGRLPFPDREGVRHDPAWPPMIVMARDRNVRMIPEMETDTVFQNRQKAIWQSFKRPPPPPDSIRSVIDRYVGMFGKFTARGGRVAIIRPPVTGYYRESEAKNFPNDSCWNRLIALSGAPSYSYEDDSVMVAMQPPEWSHLNRREADQYTRIIAGWLRQQVLR